MFFIRVIIMLSLSSLSFLVAAHPGHSAGFQEAFLHPVLGWDHLVAMFAVGMIAVRFQGWRAGALPTIFVLTLLLASMAVTALQVPLGDAAETLVLLSVVMLGGLLVLRNSLSFTAMGALVGVAGLVHGAVHGSELGMSASAALAGLAIASALLHALGYGLAKTSGLYAPSFSRFVGLAVGLLGLSALIAKISLS